MTSYCKLCGTKLWREYTYNAAGVIVPEYYNIIEAVKAALGKGE